MKLKQITPYCWEVPKTGKMRVPGRIYISAALLPAIEHEQAYRQVANVAELPGIVSYSLGMPDIHWGYGFSIGGVAAFDWETGIISPGGVGYDINCGVRLATTSLRRIEIDTKLELLANALYRNIPSGVGSTGSVRLSRKEEKRVLSRGSLWAIRQGMGQDNDIGHTEDNGCMADADPEAVSERALERGRNQLGTLGSGNHFLEISIVDTIYDTQIAEKFGLFEKQVTVMIHSGSRGLGYQICDDFLGLMTKHARKKGLDIPDKQLAYANLDSSMGQQYLKAMACAANYAWANRQILMYKTHDILVKTLGISPRELNLNLLYDVCHNIAKKEMHAVKGEVRSLCVHRKGATRAFGPGHPELHEVYRNTGQPILIPGDMGRASYVLSGTQKAMEETFGSTCHGAGRTLSRSAAKKKSKGRAIHRELMDKGILVRWTGRTTLSEELPDAYKNVSDVVDVVHGAGISKKIAKLKPLIVIKG